MAYKRRRKPRYSLTVKKGKRIWRMTNKFMSKASRDRAKRGLASIGWR